MPDEHDTTAAPLDPELEQLLPRACAEPVTIETAARHLWVIHRTAQDAPARARRRRSGGRPVVVVLALVGLLSTSGAVLASSGSALPGEVLYPVKLSGERVQQIAGLSPGRDARLQLDIARRRVAEADALQVERPAAVPGLLDAAATALARAERQAPAHGEAALVRDDAGEVLRSVARVHPELLAELDASAGRLGLRALVLVDPPASDPPASDPPASDPPAPDDAARRAPVIRRTGPPPAGPEPAAVAAAPPPSAVPSPAPEVAQLPEPVAQQPAPPPAPTPVPAPVAPDPAPPASPGDQAVAGGKPLPTMAELAARFEDEG